MADESSSHIEASQFKPGELVFENFLIVGRVGAGGMGLVYKAKNVLLDKFVALKVLPVDALSSSDLVRFQNEARALSRLEHPNVAAVYDFGIGEGRRPYLAMEFVEGETLQHILDEQGELPIEVFYEIFIQICEGLAHAHSKNVIHRDVKASNIILALDDKAALRAVLVDFGVAKIEDQDRIGKVTRTGAFVGSPLYMSPEQICGEAGGPESDVYSLCCVMFHMLAGVPPFEAENLLETLTMHREAPPPIELLENRQDVPQELCLLLERGLEKLPENRIFDASYIAKQLDALAIAQSDLNSADTTEGASAAHEGAISDAQSRAASMLPDTASGARVAVDAKATSNVRNIVVILLAASALVLTAFMTYVLFGPARPVPVDVPTRTKKSTPSVGPESTEGAGIVTALAFADMFKASEPKLPKIVEGGRNPLVHQLMRECDKVLATDVDDRELVKLHSTYRECVDMIKEGQALTPTTQNQLMQALRGCYETKVRLGIIDVAHQYEPEMEKYCTAADAEKTITLLRKVSTKYSDRKKPDYKNSLPPLLTACRLTEKFYSKDLIKTGEFELITATELQAEDHFSSKAEDYFGRARTKLERGDRNSRALLICLIREAHLARAKSNHKKAIELYREGARVANLRHDKADSNVLSHLNHGLASSLTFVGRYDEAEKKAKLALQLNPKLEMVTKELLNQIDHMRKDH